MHKIKQIPEDFIVKEINDLEFNNSGLYSYFLLKKKNYNTLRAIETIADKLRINKKNIGFAGNKDKNAVTEQVISIKNSNKDIQNIKIKDIELKYLGKGNEEIYLGRLKGNNFIITLRNLTKKEISTIEEKIKNNNISIPNYFGPQRFSNNNNLIGKAIINNNFKEAVDLIIESNSDCNEKIKQHLQKQKNDFVGALKIITFKLLKLYIHSYQSFLFNKALEQYIGTINSKKIKNNELLNENAKLSDGLINVTLPIIGFGTEIEDNNIKKIINEIMNKENINFRDFIIRAIPDLSSEGTERNTFIKVNNFKITSKEEDELNKNKEKLTVSFSLPKGSYATVLVDWLFD
jgi:tRNA pseudouridine13 synthase